MALVCTNFYEAISSFMNIQYQVSYMLSGKLLTCGSSSVTVGDLPVVVSFDVYGYSDQHSSY